MSEQVFAAPAINIPGQKITWAGEGLQDDRFLFGTETGIVLECGIDGSLTDMHALRLAKDEESINGLSFYFDDNALHLAASTRTDIIVNSFVIHPRKRRVSHAGFGSHGIKRSLSNYFVAPAGPSGVIVLMVAPIGEMLVQTVLPREELRYFYDYAALGLDAEKGLEVSVSACRSDGLVFFRTKPGQGLDSIKTSRVGEKAVDFVGVISIRNSEFPLAMIGLGKNRSMHFFRDPLQIRNIDSLEMPFVPGTAYKLLRYGMHLILLTSKGICMFPGIISQFHERENMGGDRKARFIGMEAIDMNIAFEKWLLVATPYGVVRLDLTALLPGVEIPDAIKRRLSNDLGALWKDQEDRVELDQPVLTTTTLQEGVLQGVG